MGLVRLPGNSSDGENQFNVVLRDEKGGQLGEVYDQFIIVHDTTLVPLPTDSGDVGKAHHSHTYTEASQLVNKYCTILTLIPYHLPKAFPLYSSSRIENKSESATDFSHKGTQPSPRPPLS